MNAISLLRKQLEGSCVLVIESANETSDGEWIAQASAGQNPAGFTLWHCIRCLDWAVNSAISGRAEVASEARWRGMLASTAWFGYDVSMEMARLVAATVPRAELIAYAGEVQKSVISWLDEQSEEALDSVPDLERNYRTNGLYASSPRLEEWIKEDSGTPVWQFLIGSCIAHVRFHLGEVNAQRELMRSSKRDLDQVRS
jgi:hypothetical protein